MAVPIQYRTGALLSESMLGHVNYKAESVVTVSAGVDSDVAAAFQITGEDQAAYFLVTHNGTAGTITFTVQQSADNGVADAYANVTGGVDAEKDNKVVTMTAVDRFIVVHLNPRVVTEQWVRLAFATSAASNATSVRVQALSGYRRSIR